MREWMVRLLISSKVLSPDARGESILFLLNGQRLNDLYSGGVSILNRHIAVGNLERVEILRGPGSALYGANAFTGVVNRGRAFVLSLSYGR